MKYITKVYYVEMSKPNTRQMHFEFITTGLYKTIDCKNFTNITNQFRIEHLKNKGVVFISIYFGLSANIIRNLY